MWQCFGGWGWDNQVVYTYQNAIVRTFTLKKREDKEKGKGGRGGKEGRTGEPTTKILSYSGSKPTVMKTQQYELIPVTLGLEEIQRACTHVREAAALCLSRSFSFRQISFPGWQGPLMAQVTTA